LAGDLATGRHAAAFAHCPQLPSSCDGGCAAQPVIVVRLSKTRRAAGHYSGSKSAVANLSYTHHFGVLPFTLFDTVGADHDRPVPPLANGA